MGEIPLLFSDAERDAWKLKVQQLGEEALELKQKYELKLKTLYGHQKLF